MHLRLISLLLLLASSSSSSSSSPLPPRAELSHCALSLVALSPCLSYIAGPPHSPQPAPSAVCCATFFQTFLPSGPTCLCYLVQDPLLLGFPIDTARLLALFPSCAPNNTASAVPWFYDTCPAVTGMEAMSPLPGVVPGPASTISPSIDDMRAQEPTPEMSIAACRAGRIHLLMVGLMLSVSLLI
ncbi:hypothetical protein LUZ62_053952 [Rhynchospora pubera]|uniref:Bifunctional inhibitor/plant lipid transfer protein/seed storage helical domain-containing protein n=1 Tax=Rhynchospora pubera TaxID=906938 RepID=A0AAV8DST9_9POAL|nr:hypothetical protein LUZ62_053952 [Rhynchospora pubera]